jgi:hypothetical protein
MKVNTDRSKKGFQPFDLVISIENIEELALLATLMSYHSTIPEYIYGDKPSKAKALSELMKPICDQLLKEQHQ